MKPNYLITAHVKERYLQRREKRYKHLEICQKGNCEICRHLCYELRQRLKIERHAINVDILIRLSQASESKWHINNFALVEQFQRKYGYNKTIKFLVHEDLVFVIIVETGCHCVVTCVPSKNYKPCQVANRPKFRKKTT